ncbi:FliA/WhiG family RNA polymerase sigma factor [Guptibacillus hwajinpoensis]|uniref:RNA polymerase sigma factor SigD n=1 Tax=Guptibacillus hwajinpoensis TaxID=208199 RepID=A0A0J6CU23_9BACL|nr:FliA/WhiG family RNA polymerase sigma factor [Alkalihalobacillus macyae]KMM36590.1 RNA polymerase sigma factor SigD [Alkalihalobacillus macyae]
MKSKMTKETIEYWRAWKEDKDEEAGNQLIALYRPLVDYAVQRYAATLPSSVHRDDLSSFAYQGLLDALGKFEPERDLKFETYAGWRIKGAIIDGLRQNDWVPRSVRDKARKIEEAYAVLEQTNQTSSSDHDVASYLNMTVGEVQQVMKDASLATMISVDEPVHDDDQQQIERYSVIEDDRADLPEKHLHERFIKELLAETIDRLPEKEKLVVSLVYFEELTLTEIARILDLSTSRISQLHSRALLRMKGVLRANKEHVQSM